LVCVGSPKLGIVELLYIAIVYTYLDLLGYFRYFKELLPENHRM